MKKLTAILLISVLFMLALVGCGDKYNEDMFIGKTSAEIEEEFGPFDCTIASASADGLYRNGRCGYTIKEPKKGFLGTSDEVLYFITFDENGIAVECEEGYRPGG